MTRETLGCVFANSVRLVFWGGVLYGTNTITQDLPRAVAFTAATFAEGKVLLAYLRIRTRRENAEYYTEVKNRRTEILQKTTRAEYAKTMKDRLAMAEVRREDAQRYRKESNATE